MARVRAWRELEAVASDRTVGWHLVKQGSLFTCSIDLLSVCAVTRINEGEHRCAKSTLSLDNGNFYRLTMPYEELVVLVNHVNEQAREK